MRLRKLRRYFCFLALVGFVGLSAADFFADFAAGLPALGAGLVTRKRPNRPRFSTEFRVHALGAGWLTLTGVDIEKGKSIEHLSWLRAKCLLSWHSLLDNKTVACILLCIGGVSHEEVRRGQCLH